MRKVGFVACSKTKSSQPSPAGALYTSALFKKSLLAAINGCSKVYILSAKYGAIGCNEYVHPYDLTLKTMSKTDRKEWGDKTKVQLKPILKRGDEAVLFCGQDYLNPLKDHLSDLKVSVRIPLGKKSLGTRLKALKKINNEEELEKMGESFFELMTHVWRFQNKGRLLGSTNGRQEWPMRGVYFILSANRMSNKVLPRIVRVGTHAVSRGSKTTIWNRLSTHRGTEAGLGSHRSSIFRLHVGRALMRRSTKKTWPSSWSKGQTAPKDVRAKEATLERMVSETLGSMGVIWLDIPDEAGPESERAYIERNSIGLLSRLGLLTNIIEDDWLGRYSSDWKIASSGLWNLNHVYDRPDPDFIERLRIAVARTIGDVVFPQKIAKPQASETEQFKLFSKQENST